MTRGIPGPDPFADSPERTRRAAAIAAYRHTPDATEQAARDANPYQRCPECGREEAAHWYCSGCLREMGPADWVPSLVSAEGLEAKRASMARLHASRRSALTESSRGAKEGAPAA